MNLKKLKSDLKNDIMRDLKTTKKVDDSTKNLLLKKYLENSEKDLEDSESKILKWYVGLSIILALLILGLYAAILLT